MVDNQSNQEKEGYLEEFGERYKNGLEDFLGLLEELDSLPIPPNPSSLDMNDDRDFEDLEPDELQKVKSILYKRLEVGENKIKSPIRNYESQASPEAKVPGMIKVSVLKTNMENVVLQEMIFSDGATRWVVGPDINI